MKHAVKYLTLVDLIFVFVLALSGSIGGALGRVVYFLAFGIPLFIGMYFSRELKREREAIAGVAEPDFLRFGMGQRELRLFAPLVVPTVALIMLAAWLTALLLNALGMTGGTVADAPFLLQLLLHALIPAILEEMLFRYLPIKLILPYSPRGCVIISALFFALIHLDLYKLPYAFLAGLIFAVIDIACDSILPSLIIHLLNNAASLATMKYGAVDGFLTVFYSALGVLLAVSLVFVFLRRRDYLAAARRATARGRVEYDGTVLLMIVTCLGVALANAIF